MYKKFFIVDNEFNKFKMAILADDAKFLIDDRIKTEDFYSQIYFQNKSGNNKLVYTEDYVIDLKYISLSGDNAEENFTFFVSKIKVIKQEDILQLFKNDDHKARIYAIYAASILGQERKGADLLESLLSAFDDPEADVRSAAIISYGYLRWPELLERIKVLSEEDLDANVKRGAQTMIDAQGKF